MTSLRCARRSHSRRSSCKTSSCHRHLQGLRSSTPYLPSQSTLPNLPILHSLCRPMPRYRFRHTQQNLHFHHDQTLVWRRHNHHLAFQCPSHLSSVRSLLLSSLPHLPPYIRGLRPRTHQELSVLPPLNLQRRRRQRQQRPISTLPSRYPHSPSALPSPTKMLLRKSSPHLTVKLPCRLTINHHGSSIAYKRLHHHYSRS